MGLKLRLGEALERLALKELGGQPPQPLPDQLGGGDPNSRDPLFIRKNLMDKWVLVEKVPSATGKHSLCDGFRLLLTRWTCKLSFSLQVAKTISTEVEIRLFC
jgi:hypothetical protein